MNLEGSYITEITRSVLGQPYTEEGQIHLSKITLCNDVEARALSGIVGFEDICGVYIPNEAQNIDSMRFFGDTNGNVALYNLTRNFSNSGHADFRGIRIESDMIRTMFESYDIHRKEVNIESMIRFYNIVAFNDFLSYTTENAPQASLSLNLRERPKLLN